MSFESPPKRGRTTQVHKLNDITQISALSYKSGFGFIFFMTDTNNVKKVLKAYILDPNAGYNTESQDFELPNYINVELAQKPKAKPAESGFADDVGESKRIESLVNFNKEVKIQKKVYEASSSNGPLCPQIYDSYIVENNKSLVFLKGLLEKCLNDAEAQNMIQYLIDNKGRYDIGCIIMEYAEEYTISSVENSENVIYANLRLLLETGYLHLDLNYGNVMVRGENDIYLIDFGKSKKILHLLNNAKDIENFNIIQKIAVKDVLDANDIIQLIKYINYFDRKYGVEYNLFQQNFVGISNTYYANIANKLNARPNKILHLDLTNRINDIDNSTISLKNTSSSMFDSPPGKDLVNSLPKNVFKSSIFDSPLSGNNLFGQDDNENMNPNLMYTPQKSRGISNPPTGLTGIRGLRGGTKRKHKINQRKHVRISQIKNA